ncbi:saccharopine dehydrogenase family protein [Euzebya tangerina]|uniref:saccharopine dehydrogenase family protein n=1 Tax=Euzebya tangerina TaxID=591198 RepID=UPI000E31EAB1|nr:saccharopine dehydrogenase NADP-binding domain-containing protein [Euzebya tangerina]
MSDRPYDLVIYGATGFTGRLVAEHLLTRAPDGFSWAMAGRSAEKLATVAHEIGAEGIPHVVADSTDPDSLAAMAQATKVVCTTVGPYARFGTPVVEACVKAGTDYTDLTGEVPWMRRMIDATQVPAQATGARIVHTCGFDSIPSDLGVFFAQQEMMRRHGVYASQVRFRLKAARGGASGGTLASGMAMLAEAKEDPEVRNIMADPYALNPEGHRNGPDQNDAVAPKQDEAFGQWVGPFVMAAVNTRVVRRTNALLDYPWGHHFRYEEGMLMGAGLAGAAKAGILGAGTAGGMAALSVDPLRRLAERAMPDAGTGPGPKARENGFFDIRLVAEHPEDPTKTLLIRVTGDMDPGYGSTSKMLAEASITLAEGKADVGGGHWTPASAMGEPLLEGLQAHAGLTFEVL